MGPLLSGQEPLGFVVVDLPEGCQHLLDVCEEAAFPDYLQGAFPDGLVHAAVVSPGGFQWWVQLRVNGSPWGSGQMGSGRTRMSSSLRLPSGSLVASQASMGHTLESRAKRSRDWGDIR